jgi:hypothetical protein
MASDKQIRVAPPTTQHNIQRRNSPQSRTQVLATRAMDTPVRRITPTAPPPASAQRRALLRLRLPRFPPSQGSCSLRLQLRELN